MNCPRLNMRGWTDLRGPGRQGNALKEMRETLPGNRQTKRREESFGLFNT